MPKSEVGQRLFFFFFFFKLGALFPLLSPDSWGVGKRFFGKYCCWILGFGGTTLFSFGGKGLLLVFFFREWGGVGWDEVGWGMEKEGGGKGGEGKGKGRRMSIWGRRK